MIFSARIRPFSSTFRLWTRQARLGGILGGVQFRKADPQTFVSEPLTDDQIEALRLHPDIVLEAVNVLPTVEAVEAAREPDIPTPQAVAPKRMPTPPPPRRRVAHKPTRI